MIKRKIKLVRRKQRLSNILLSDRETRMIQWLESQTWIGEYVVSLTIAKLKRQDVLWKYTLECLVYKGRIKNLNIYRTKCILEVIPPPPPLPVPRDKPTTF